MSSLLYIPDELCETYEYPLFETPIITFSFYGKIIIDRLKFKPITYINMIYNEIMKIEE